MRMKLYAGLALAGLLVACAGLPSGTGSDAATIVAQVELGYTPLATAAAAYLNSGGADATTKATIKRLNDAIDTKAADGTRTGLLVAARTAAQSGDSVTAAAETEALKQAIAALASYEASKGIK